MNNLVDWLKRQLDDDERVAREARERTPGRWVRTDEGALRSDDTGGNGYFATGPWGAGIDDDVAEHIARWDPARVLAEVDAKRRILDRLAETLSTASEHFTVESCDEDDAILAETTMRLLALPYAGRDGYRDEWRP